MSIAFIEYKYKYIQYIVTCFISMVHFVILKKIIKHMNSASKHILNQSDQVRSMIHSLVITLVFLVHKSYFTTHSMCMIDQVILS